MCGGVIRRWFCLVPGLRTTYVATCPASVSARKCPPSRRPTLRPKAAAETESWSFAALPAVAVGLAENASILMARTQNPLYRRRDRTDLGPDFVASNFVNIWKPMSGRIRRSALGDLLCRQIERLRPDCDRLPRTEAEGRLKSPTLPEIRKGQSGNI